MLIAALTIGYLRAKYSHCKMVAQLNLLSKKSLRFLIPTCENMKYERVAIEIESPEEYGYEVIRHNLSESSIAHQSLQSLDLSTPNLTLLYNEHRGGSILRKLIS